MRLSLLLLLFFKVSCSFTHPQNTQKFINNGPIQPEKTSEMGTDFFQQLIRRAIPSALTVTPYDGKRTLTALQLGNLENQPNYHKLFLARQYPKKYQWQEENEESEKTQQVKHEQQNIPPHIYQQMNEKNTNPYQHGNQQQAEENEPLIETEYEHEGQRNDRSVFRKIPENVHNSQPQNPYTTPEQREQRQEYASQAQQRFIKQQEMQQKQIHQQQLQQQLLKQQQLLQQQQLQQKQIQQQQLQQQQLQQQQLQQQQLQQQQLQQQEELQEQILQQQKLHQQQQQQQQQQLLHQQMMKQQTQPQQQPQQHHQQQQIRQPQHETSYLQQLPTYVPHNTNFKQVFEDHYAQNDEEQDVQQLQTPEVLQNTDQPQEPEEEENNQGHPILQYAPQSTFPKHFRQPAGNPPMPGIAFYRYQQQSPHAQLLDSSSESQHGMYLVHNRSVRHQPNDVDTRQPSFHLRGPPRSLRPQTPVVAEAEDDKEVPAAESNQRVFRTVKAGSIKVVRRE